MFSKFALVFPGEGIERPGMGRALYEKYPQAKNILASACETLGFSIRDIMFEGPDEELLKTKNAQLAVFLSNMMVYSVIKDALGERPLFAAGHSLGEYCALVAAGALSFEDSVVLVEKRGEIMQENMPDGGMSAVMGMRTYDVVNLCREISESGKLLVAANFNARLETVISGTREGIAEFGRKLPGGAKIIPLKAAGPFHSFLMRRAQDKFAREIDGVYFSAPEYPVVSNFSAQAEDSPSKIAEHLKNQIASPVKWVSSVEFMVRRGVQTFIECSERSVLARMIENISPEVKTLNALTLLG